MQSHLRHEFPSPRIHLILLFLHRAQTFVPRCRGSFVAGGFDLEPKPRALLRLARRVPDTGFESSSGEPIDSWTEVPAIVGDSCVVYAPCADWKAWSILYQSGQIVPSVKILAVGGPEVQCAITPTARTGSANSKSAPWYGQYLARMSYLERNSGEKTSPTYTRLSLTLSLTSAR